MNKLFKPVVAAIGLFGLIVPVAHGADAAGHSKTKLSGFSEVHAPSLNQGVFSAGSGAISSTGSGELELQIDWRNREIRYKLTYEFPDAAQTPLAGAQFVNQAHFHFGQEHTTGGITVWLCQGDNLAPETPVNIRAITPTCPSPSGSVEGSIVPTQVLGVAGQGLPAGEDGFDVLLRALQAGSIYANVHTDRFPPGEIRGQVRLNQGRND
jgi:hypothetical protein